MPDSGAAAVPDMKRTGWVGADKFQQNFFLLADIGLAEFASLKNRLLQSA